VKYLVCLGLLAACQRHAEAPAKQDAAARDAAAPDAAAPGDAGTADAKATGPKVVVNGRSFQCSLFDDGSVTCDGDIGFGPQAKTTQPTAVPGVSKAELLYAIGGAACAISDGTVACWGDVDERGRITNNHAHRLPTAVLGATRELVTGATEVAATGTMTCALHDDGNVYCIAPHPICMPKALKKPPPPKKGKKPAKPAPAPPPAEPKSPFELLHLPKGAHLAFDLGPCVMTTTKSVECLDPHDACKSVRVAAPPAKGKR